MPRQRPHIELKRSTTAQQLFIKQLIHAPPEDDDLITVWSNQ